MILFNNHDDDEDDDDDDDDIFIIIITMYNSNSNSNSCNMEKVVYLQTFDFWNTYIISLRKSGTVRVDTTWPFFILVTSPNN